MSTLGKVLVILIVLAVIGWMFLASGIAQYNINWGKRLQDVAKEVEDLKKPFPQLHKDIADNTYLASTLQVELERSRRDFRANLAMAQKTESETKETLSRVNDQLAAATLEAQFAQRRVDKRLAERVELEEAIKKEKAVVADLMADNKAKKDTLASLQSEFVALLTENKTYVTRLLKKPQKTTTVPSTRLGSFVR